MPRRRLRSVRRVSPKDIDIRTIDAVLTNNGEVVAQGRKDVVLIR